MRSGGRFDNTRQVRLPDLTDVGIHLDQFVGRLADELRIVPDVATSVDWRTERLVAFCLDGFDDLRVRVYALGHLQHGQPEFFAARPQTRADATRFQCHANQPEL